MTDDKENVNEFNPDENSNVNEFNPEESGNSESSKTEYNDAFADEVNPYAKKEFTEKDEFSTEENDTFEAPNFLESTEADSSSKIDSSSYNSKKEETKEETVYNTSTKEEKDIAYSAKKVSAEAASNLPHEKPKQLNKKFLLTVIVVVFAGIFMITFLMPQKNKNKKNGAEKPIAQAHRLSNYEANAKHYEEETVPVDTGSNSSEASEKEEDTIPPLLPEKKPYEPTTYQPYTASSGSGKTIEIPDTRNDRLQGKAISGIKGLTSTQGQYQTDYQTTVAKNASSSPVTNAYQLPSKEEYTKSVMAAYSAANGGQSNYTTQNDQAGKNSFYNNGRDTSNVGSGQWLGLNTIWQGTIFEATLTSELNTDLPGEITARTAKNIYSSQDGRYLLIPQNSVLYGTYNSSISYSQSRVQVVWNKLIRPDGYEIQLGSMNGTDAKGASGLKGLVNDHPLAYLKAIGLMSVFSIMNTEFATATKNTNNQYVENVIANSQQVTNELSNKLIDRAMNVQPTIKVKAGTKINIVANQTLDLPPCEQIPVTQQYHRY